MNNETENSPKSNDSTKKGKGAKDAPEKRNRILLPTILFLIILPLSIFVLSQERNKKTPEANQKTNQTQNVDSPVVLYYSDQCPHCKDLEKWIEENDIQDKTAFARKEVGKNQQNAGELIGRAGICNIPEDELGVPFLWDGNTKKCFMGNAEITAYFQGKISGSETSTASQSQTAQDNADVTNKTKEK
jgi:glutaredoxin